MTGKDYEEKYRICGYEKVSENLFVEDELIYAFRVYDNYDQFEEFNKNQTGEFIYVLELEGNCIKIGYTSLLTGQYGRIKTHCKSKRSKFYEKVKRIGILGPVQNGYILEQMIHNYCMIQLLSKDYSSNEVYKFPLGNSFDMFMTRFEFFQGNALCGELQYFKNMQFVVPSINNS